MKTYIHEGRVIREDELKEITIMKVGDRFRFTKDGFMGCNKSKKGDVVTVTKVLKDSFLTNRLDGLDGSYDFGIHNYPDGLELVPSPPVCPDELLPLPEGAVYLGQLTKISGRPKYYYSKVDPVRWEANIYGWITDDYNSSHYATTAGDACHRAQPWFDESQVPKELTLEVGKRYVMRNGKITKPLVDDQEPYKFAEVIGSAMAWTKEGNYWEDGRKEEKDIIREATPEECGEVTKELEPIDLILQKLNQLEELVAEIEILTQKQQ